MLYLIVFLFGLVVGSFANVCIYRLPRNISIITPSSRCPSCHRPIRAYENIPLISYVLLKGRCRGCGWRIPLRYPAVELFNALLYVVVLHRYGLTPAGVFFMVFSTVLLIITFIDLEFQIIPDILTIPGSLAGVLAGIFILPDCFQRGVPLGAVQSVTGAVLGFVLYFSIAFISKGGMGGGDIKMMAMVGAVTGWKGVLLTTFIGSLAGSLVGIMIMVLKGKGRKTKIPFGPFLALGTLVSILYGEEVLRWYLGY